jgi:HEAT repeat protein
MSVRRQIWPAKLPSATDKVIPLIQALAARPREEVFDGLMNALASTEPSVRCVAALSLSNCESEAAVLALVRAVDEGPESVSRCAGWALARFHGSHSLRALLAILQKLVETQPSDLRWPPVGGSALDEVKQGLQRRPLDESLPLLEEVYRVGGPTLRQYIIEIVSANPDKAKTEPLLLHAAKDPSVDVRRDALTAVAGLSSDSAVRALHAALDDPEPGLAKTAVSLLTFNSHPAANRLLSRWLTRTTRGNWRAFSASQLAAVRESLKQEVSNIGLDDKESSAAATLLDKAVDGTELTQACRTILKRMPPATRAQFDPTFDPQALVLEPDGDSDDPSTRAGRELAALPIALAARKMSVAPGAQQHPIQSLFQGMAEEEIADRFTDLIQAHGRSLLPLLRELLARRDTPEPVRCALCLALGRASDRESAAKFVSLLESPSEALRQSAMRALSDLGDAASPHLTVALAAKAPNAQIVAQSLQEILDGNPPPALPDLVRRSVLDVYQKRERDSRDQTPPGLVNSPPHEETADNSEDELARMSFAEHLMELCQRLGIVFAGVMVADLTAAQLAPTGPGFLARLYGVSPTTAAAYLPAGAHLKEWSGVVAAAWFGFPLFLYQMWCFVAAGLYRAERKLAVRPVLTACGLFAGLPLILLVMSRAIALMPFHHRDSVRLIRITEHSTLAIALLIGWIVGFKRIWLWLGLRMRTSYISGVFERVDTTQRRRRVSIRTLLVVQAISSVMLAALVPYYVVSCLFVGFILALTLLFAVVWGIMMLTSVIPVEKLRRKAILNPFRAAMFRVLIPVLGIPILVLLVLVFRYGFLMHLLEVCHISLIAGWLSNARIEPRWPALLHLVGTGVWLSVSASIMWRQTAALVLSLTDLRAPSWTFHLGASAAFIAVVAPAIVLPPSTGLYRLILAVCLALVLMLCASLAASGMAKFIWAMIPFPGVLAVTSQAPSMVRWGMVLWPVALAALVAPSLIYLAFNLPMGLPATIGTILHEFREENRKAQTKYSKYVPGSNF